MSLKGRAIRKVAEFVDREYLLQQLKVEWTRLLGRDFNIEEEADKAWTRVMGSKEWKDSFEVVGITKEDIIRILSEIRREKE